MSDDQITSPRLRELLRMRGFVDEEIRNERQRLVAGGHSNLVRAASELYGVTVEAIHGGDKSKSATAARMVSCWLLREAGMSYPEVGRSLNVHHTTAMHACRVIDGSPARLNMARSLMAQEVAA